MKIIINDEDIRVTHETLEWGNNLKEFKVFSSKIDCFDNMFWQEELSIRNDSDVMLYIVLEKFHNLLTDRKR